MGMDKVYVRFGNISRSDTNISVFEGVLEDNVVRLIMPSTLYTTCQAIARHLDEPAFIVDGDVAGKGKDGEPLLSNCRIKIPLTFDKKLETYTCDERIPHKREKRGNLNVPAWFHK
jgi:hypothetical protein